MSAGENHMSERTKLKSDVWSEAPVDINKALEGAGCGWGTLLYNTGTNLFWALQGAQVVVYCLSSCTCKKAIENILFDKRLLAGYCPYDCRTGGEVRMGPNPVLGIIPPASLQLRYVPWTGSVVSIHE